MRSRFQFVSVVFVLVSFCLWGASVPAQDSKVMGEVKFEGNARIDGDAGVCVDGECLGYVKELKSRQNSSLPWFPESNLTVVSGTLWMS